MRKHNYHQAVKRKTRTESLPDDVKQSIRQMFPRLSDFIARSRIDLLIHKDVFYRAMRNGKCSARVKKIIMDAWELINTSTVPRGPVELGLDWIIKDIGGGSMTRAELLAGIIKLNNMREF